MIYRVVITARARAETVKAFRWKAEQSSRSATRWLAGLEKAIAGLSQSPERHPIAEEETEQTGIIIRQMIYGRKPRTYRILFSIEGEAVVLHSIRHAARGPFDRDDFDPV